ncbi:uncharacterized protein LOC122958863 [Acropora millepora]|uniref:uncharacterized protein LOC122958863 n=1 Tax=Acropora millepora TaxID=45264 RepID=UPI001CF498CB|nr:uncharacterized protein LOC122958863 [Acropora millepora]
MYLELVQKKELPGCYIVLTSRPEGGTGVRRFTDTLLEIVGFTRTDAESYIRKYFKQDKAHLAEELISKFWFQEELTELTQNPLNTLLLCVIFEDLEGVLPDNRTQLYMEIVLFILRRYESKEGLSSRGKDLLLVYKKELMILGRTALDSLRKQELYFDDHKGDIKDMLTDPRYMGELFQVFKFMSTIIAKESVETAVSVVERIASILTRDELVPYLKVAHCFINECKSCSEDLDTNLAHTFGKSLKLVEVVLWEPWTLVPSHIGTFFKALAVNSTVKNLYVSMCEPTLNPEDINLLTEALTVNKSLSSLDLSNGPIGDEGANSLAHALRVNTSLSSLKMSFIKSIGAEGADSLAQALEALSENASLSSLNLNGNGIRNEGANSLAQALRENTSITTLDLGNNSIGDEGD